MKTDGTNGGNGGSGSAAPASQKPKTLAQFLEEKKASFGMLLPRHISVDRFMKIVLSALIANPKLAACTQVSMLTAVKQCAEAGLEPNGFLGQAAIIPYKNGDKLIATFQPMYKGIISLAYRSGQMKTITAHEVCQKDEFFYQYGLNADLRHIPAEGDRGEVTKYYAYYLTKDGGFDFVVLTKEDARKHAEDYSRAYQQEKKDSPWFTNFDAMAKKTALLKLLKYAPMSVEIAEDILDENGMRNVTPAQELMESEVPALPMTPEDEEVAERGFELAGDERQPGEDK